MREIKIYTFDELSKDVQEWVIREYKANNLCLNTETNEDIKNELAGYEFTEDGNIIN